MYGTTVDSLLETEETESGRVIPPSPKGKNIRGTVTLNERGQIVIPKAARDHFSLAAGQRLVLLSDDDEGFAIVPAGIFERKLDLVGRILSSADE